MADFKSESPADFISEWPADMHRIPQVIDTANDAGIQPADLPAWVIKQGGVEAVRRVTKDGLRPAEKVRNAVDKVESALKQIKPLLTLDQLPQELHPDVNSPYELTLALVRYDSATGRGHIVCASGKASLIKQFLASVASRVAASNENDSAARDNAVSLEKRNAVIAAAVAAAQAALDTNEKIAA